MLEIADIHSYLKGVQHVSLATLEQTDKGFRPRVRTMNFISHKQTFWFVSYGKDAKVRQLEQNPEFEFCAKINHKDSLGSIRVRGTAKIIDDSSIKEEIRPSVWFFDRFFSGLDDPNYVPIQLKISEIISQNPKDKRFYRFLPDEINPPS
ncbi:MAG: pyridoxamine 5'-phosphate oxidase family protein [Promethearchaeota archaeon]